MRVDNRLRLANLSRRQARLMGCNQLRGKRKPGFTISVRNVHVYARFLTRKEKIETGRREQWWGPYGYFNQLSIQLTHVGAVRSGNLALRVRDLQLVNRRVTYGTQL